MVQKQSFLWSGLYVKWTKTRGRGVFTNAHIGANTLIEIAPVIVMSGAERKLIDQTLLHDYIFEWGDDQQQCCMALGLVPIYNHAAPSNCEYEMNFSKEIITVKTVVDIKGGQELFINYNGDWDNDKKVWFPLSA